MFRSLVFFGPSPDHFWYLNSKIEKGVKALPEIKIGNLYKPFQDVILIHFQLSAETIKLFARMRKISKIWMLEETKEHFR